MDKLTTEARSEAQTGIDRTRLATMKLEEAGRELKLTHREIINRMQMNRQETVWQFEKIIAQQQSNHLEVAYRLRLAQQELRVSHQETMRELNELKNRLEDVRTHKQHSALQ